MASLAAAATQPAPGRARTVSACPATAGWPASLPRPRASASRPRACATATGNVKPRRSLPARIAWENHWDAWRPVRATARERARWLRFRPARHAQWTARHPPRNAMQLQDSAKHLANARPAPSRLELRAKVNRRRAALPALAMARGRARWRSSRLAAHARRRMPTSAMKPQGPACRRASARHSSRPPARLVPSSRDPAMAPQVPATKAECASLRSSRRARRARSPRLALATSTRALATQVACASPDWRRPARLAPTRTAVSKLADVPQLRATRPARASWCPSPAEPSAALVPTRAPARPCATVQGRASHPPTGRIVLFGIPTREAPPTKARTCVSTARVPVASACRSRSSAKPARPRHPTRTHAFQESTRVTPRVSAAAPPRRASRARRKTLAPRMASATKKASVSGTSRWGPAAGQRPVPASSCSVRPTAAARPSQPLDYPVQLPIHASSAASATSPANASARSPWAQVAAQHPAPASPGSARATAVARRSPPRAAPAGST